MIGAYGSCSQTLRNQSVENAGAALVRGADERNKFFEKKKKTISNV